MAKAEADTYWVGLDLGGTKMQATVFDAKLKPVGGKRKKTKAQAGAEAGVARVIAAIREAVDDAGLAASAPDGIGMGLPGPLDLDRGILLDLPNLGWRNVPIRDLVQDAFKCPVVVGNDVDVGVYGEYRAGAATGARCVLGVFPGTGIGGGCVYRGKLLRGKTNSCMEIGHLCVVPDGPLCGCGRRGCLETVASRLAISAAAAAAAYRGQAPNLLKAAGMDLANIRSRTLADAIKAGDKAIEEIVRGAARWLGLAIGMAVNLLAPDVVVLGGGLVEAIPDLLLKETAAAARAACMPSFSDSFKVAAAKLGDDAAVTGAAHLAHDTVTGASKDERK